MTPDAAVPADGGLSRRSLLLGAAATIVTFTACSSDDGASPRARPSASAPAAATPCVLTPELTAGPYYLDGPRVRRDITERRPGVPLELRVRVVHAGSCAPLAGAAVDVWHCDADGEYSGFDGNSLAETSAGGRNDGRSLRGVQLTRSDGVATFTTIFPGWYEGRSVHVHLRVHVGGTIDRTYDGGHVAHTGQVFFDEALTARVMTIGPYRAHTGERTTNADDSLFSDAGPGAIAALTPERRADLIQGFTGDITCVVDPAATPPPAPMF